MGLPCGQQHTPCFQARVPVRRQRQDQNAFRRFRTTATKAAAASVANTAPAGRQEAAAPVLRRDKRLGQNRTDAVNRREVLDHAPRRHAQNPRCKVTDRNRRTDQETRQADHLLKMPLTACVIPTKPGIPRRQDTRRRGKQKAAEPAMRRADQVTQLTAHVKPRAARVFRCHQLVENQPKLRSLNPDKLKTLDRTRTGRKTRRLGNRRLPAGNAPATAATARRRKNYLARTLKAAKRAKATRDLGPPAKVNKTERTADPATNLRPRSIRLRQNIAVGTLVSQRPPHRSGRAR